MIARAITLSVLCASAAWGCTAPEPRDAPGTHDRSSKTRRVEKNAGPPGRVEGIVRFEGELPPVLPVNVTGPHAAECDGARGVYEMSVVRGPDGGMANVFVSVEGVPRGAAPVPQTRTVAIDGCVLKPYVIDGTVGDTLEIRNEDEHVFLCTLGGGPDAAFKQAVLAGQAASLQLDRPGGRRIDCTQDHPWLWGHVLVARHPYHAVTTASGRFTIENVPPGRYAIQAWHPTQRQARPASVTVTPGGTAQVEVVFQSRPTAAAPSPSAAPSPAAAPAPAPGAAPAPAAAPARAADGGAPTAPTKTN